MEMAEDRIEELLSEQRQFNRAPEGVYEAWSQHRERCIQLESLGLYTLPATFMQLRSLASIDLSDNFLTTLPDCFQFLPELLALNLCNNRLRSLPNSLLELAMNGELRQLYLQDNDDLGIPVEILGSSPPTYHFWSSKWLISSKKSGQPVRIARYWRQLEAGPTKTLSEAKLLVVGPGGHGKSSLIEYLRDGTFEKGKKATPGIVVRPWMVPSTREREDLRINVWDFGGQEIQYSTHEFFLTERAVYLLVFQPRDDQATAQGLYYWLDLIHLIAPHAPVIVVLSKQDEYDGFVNDAADLKKLHPKLVDFIPISCDQSDPASSNATHLRQLIVETVHREIKLVRYKLPSSWMDVKMELEKVNTPFLSYPKYQALCVAKGIVDTEDQKLLASFLNDLGTMLNYADRMPLEDTHILNPGWVTEGVYAVVLSQELHHAQGVFDEGMITQLLSGPVYRGKYPQEAQRFILQMMLSFKLCYELDRTGKTSRYLVPNALPVEPPAGADAPLGDTLRFEIQFPKILPTSVVSRFIVAMHSRRPIDKRWRLGMRSEMEGHEYLVTAHPKEKCIRIAVGGTGPKRIRVLEVIRHHFAVICAEREGLGAREFTFPPGYPDANPVAFNALLEAERAGKESIWLPDEIGDISVREWLDGVTTPQLRETVQKAINDAKRYKFSKAISNTNYYAETINIGHDMSTNETKSVVVTAQEITNAAIGIDQHLNNSLKMVQQAPEGELKTALLTLHSHMLQLLKQLDQKQSAKALKNLNKLTEEATSSEPDPSWVQVSGEGLIEAAKTVSAIATPIIETVQKILHLFPV